MTAKKVLIVHHEAVARIGLMRVIKQMPDFDYVAPSTFSAPSAIEEVGCNGVNMVVMAPEAIDDPLTVMRQMLELKPYLAILIMPRNEQLWAMRCSSLGIRGCVEMTATVDEVKEALSSVARGDLYWSPYMREKIINAALNRKRTLDPREILSDREFEVFNLLGRGFGTREIAVKLERSSKTIESFRAHIKKKMKLHNATELLQCAIMFNNDGN